MVGFDVGSSIGIFEYDKGSNTSKKLPTIKLDCSSIQPRHLLIVPNRRVFITKNKKQRKIICDLGLDTQRTLKFSPWKTAKSETLIKEMVCVEVGSNSNPVLACLELDGRQPQFHELILESKHAKALQPNPIKLDSEINMISTSSGVLLFDEDKVSYIESSNKKNIQCSIPRRGTDSSCQTRSLHRI